MTMNLTSSAFQHGHEIPQRHTCQGGDLSPPLAWSDVPANAKSPVLIVDDPDAPDPAAPKIVWVHWVLYNSSPTAGGLAESAAGVQVPPGTLAGTNDWKRVTYGDPCPPIGRHRYFFKLYAIDATLPDLGKPSKSALEKAMKGHVIAQAHLLGTYQKD
ncbi:phosphatidylethanolamine-binding protein [Paraburkholderia steynii]|uniref:Phosphatidylethanolamine-binding protein n=1 Tax=Paraburkholderia steynii TaxID=1245441 RepID=A0A4R0XCZ9_9BURK|nr:phosphatidylethanolamine-binding protein [Paraburkholderia steynii]